MARGLIERYKSWLHGVLSCYDRMVMTGTLPQTCYAQGMRVFPSAKGLAKFVFQAEFRSVFR
jgi:hypothetical protein